MNKFIGQAYLLDVSTFKSKDEQTGEWVSKFKYTFLTGEQDTEGAFIKKCSIETYITDRAILPKATFMQLIDVAISLRETFSKVNGEVCKKLTPMYEVLEKVGK